MNAPTRKKEALMKMLNNSLVDLPTPATISFLWNIGFMLSMILLMQILTGVVLSMHFTNLSSVSFESVLMITRNVGWGWVVRFIHMNGASMMFLLMFFHITRGLFFSSPHNKKSVWGSGIFILLISMATAFLGYVLPWGQMSFWGAAVITNMFSAIPYMGKEIVQWLWGNFSVSGPTLTRFFSLHYILPLLMSAMVIFHLIFLHSTGSSTPIGILENSDKMKFSPSMMNKDFLSITVMILTLVFISSNFPMILGDVENFNKSNPLMTPVHIQPEWYFLFAYAILRSIPSKLGGAVALIASILVLFMMAGGKNKPKKFSPSLKLSLWTTVVVFLILTWVGMNPVEPPFVKTGQLMSTLYFMMVSIQ